MPHRFRKGDPVFYTPKDKDFENLKGMYTVEEPNKEGDIYRIADSGGNFTDADEGELDPLMYAVFIKVEGGWPIIIPLYDEALYQHYSNSELYKLHLGSTADICIREMASILRKLEEEKKD